jgi:hypothetical protein
LKGARYREKGEGKKRRGEWEKGRRGEWYKVQLAQPKNEGGGEWYQGVQLS